MQNIQTDANEAQHPQVLYNQKITGKASIEIQHSQSRHKPTADESTPGKLGTRQSGMPHRNNGSNTGKRKARKQDTERNMGKRNITKETQNGNSSKRSRIG